MQLLRDNLTLWTSDLPEEGGNFMKLVHVVVLWIPLAVAFTTMVWFLWSKGPCNDVILLFDMPSYLKTQF